MEYEITAEAALAEGAMQKFERAGRKLLLARVDGACHAVSATCPHAGGPLDEGVMRGGVVVCPWHKAAFRVATGRRVEPPAVDDLERFPVREADGRVFVTIADDVQADTLAAGAPDPRCMVIIGAGAAGTVAAQTLREEGFTGRVVLIGREDRLPYDRTILSKYVLSGQEGGEKSPLQDEAFYRRHRIERRAQEVVAIEPAARRVRFAGGDGLTYDAALVAPGGVPRPLRLPGADLAGVFLLRTAADAEAIVAATAEARHVVVVGAGFIAIEAAGSLRERGLAVTVVAPQAAPFERQLGPEIGGVFRRVHEQQGVVFRLGDEVVALEGVGRVHQVRLKSGGVLPADLVVAGLGVSPATGPLQGLAARKDGGVDVDRCLQLMDGLYAAGDIAAFPLRGDAGRVRVEHWRVAEQHGRVAALNMLGGRVVYDAVPYFWTIHYKKRLDYVGHAETWDELVIDGDLATPDFMAFYIRDATVAAVAGWGRDRQMAHALMLMTERRRWTAADLRGALVSCP